MKSKSVKVSVIIPAHNAAGSIDQAIQSVLSQKGVSFEILIGDDGSQDDTWKQLRIYREHPKVRLFRFRRNQGVSITRNKLVARAKGKYISSCDADDLLLPGNLAVFAGILDKNPSVGVSYGDLQVRPQKGKSWIKRRFRPLKSWDLLGGCFADGGTMIRRSLFLKAGGYKPGLSFLEDCELFLRLSEMADFFYRPGKPLYVQNKISGSLSDQPTKKLKEISQTLLRNAIQRRYGVKVKW